MAFEELDSATLTTGKPVKQELWTKVKNSLDDHEERISDLEAATASTEPLVFYVKGNYVSFGTYTGAAHRRLSNNITITAVRILIIDGGTAGTTEIDLLYKRGVGAFTSIFTTKPSVAYTAGDYTLSSNAVILTTDLLASDILRLDITSSQTGNEEFHVYVDYTVSA
jgi:hypothetical protein